MTNFTPYTQAKKWEPHSWREKLQFRSLLCHSSLYNIGWIMYRMYLVLQRQTLTLSAIS